MSLRNRDQLWDIWLHKVFTDQSFEQFRAGVVAKAAAPVVTKRSAARAVAESRALLEGFRP